MHKVRRSHAVSSRSVGAPLATQVAGLALALVCLPWALLRSFARGDCIATYAGTGERGDSGDGGPATVAQLNGPYGVALDRNGNLYIADYWNHRIRKVNLRGLISTVAGNGSDGFAGDGGPATTAQLLYPRDVTLDRRGNLYVADSNNHRIRKVDRNGMITTVAGNGADGFAGDGGPATAAWLSEPCGVAVDDDGLLYIADTWNHRIRRVEHDGTIVTVAGRGARKDDDNTLELGDGGPALAAQLGSPRGVAVDRAGNMYIADTWHHRIRMVDRRGIINTIAGTGEGGHSGDGEPASAAQLYYPSSVTLDDDGNLYIADTWNYRIRRIDCSGIITTVAGAGLEGDGGDGGPALLASLNNPSGIAVDRSGNLFIADYLNNRVRKVFVSAPISVVERQRGRRAAGLSSIAFFLRAD